MSWSGSQFVTTFMWSDIIISGWEIIPLKDVFRWILAR